MEMVQESGRVTASSWEWLCLLTVQNLILPWFVFSCCVTLGLEVERCGSGTLPTAASCGV